MKTIIFLCVLGLALSAPIAEDKDVKKDAVVKVAATKTKIPVKKEVENKPAVREDVDDKEEYPHHDEEYDNGRADADNDNEDGEEQRKKDVDETTPSKDPLELHENAKEDVSVIARSKEDEEIAIADFDKILKENIFTEVAKDTPYGEMEDAVKMKLVKMQTYNKDVKKDAAMKVAAFETQIPVKKEVKNKPAVSEDVDDEEDYPHHDEEYDNGRADADNDNEDAEEQRKKDVEETTPSKDALELHESAKEDASVIARGKEDEEIAIADFDKMLKENRFTEEAKDTRNGVMEDAVKRKSVKKRTYNLFSK